MEHCTQKGAATAEYALGTAAVTGFAGSLSLFVPWFDNLLRYLPSIVTHWPWEPFLMRLPI